MQRRGWDDDRSILQRCLDALTPDLSRYGGIPKTRKSHTKLRKANEHAWSSGMIHVCDNQRMVCCCLCCGTCIQHGHNQDLMNNTGCCVPCVQACLCGLHCCEMTRARREMRVRLDIKGAWAVDCCLVCACPCLTVCQETRELEIRTKQVWHPIWGFRVKTRYNSSFLFSGQAPLLHDICCGEERLTTVVPFKTPFLKSFPYGRFADDEEELLPLELLRARTGSLPPEPQTETTRPTQENNME
uniref:Uncharacterized protein n=1 Tax=Guillardia theta TaxID=55529 RepID=A0A7S4PJ92_GUITH|mmetsp:Transcript_52275/g.162298  ORF Transcript_52275/g.162298 Transcript_52275/m.162298 type:complete len:243 (+) Transcript_52275:78-806(+)